MMDEDSSEKREVLTAKVSSHAANGWRDFCARNGVSVAAFIEIAGREMAAETIPPTEKARNRMVTAAREVDQQRRSRRK